MSRIYTRTGDTGETGLFGGGRVRKHELRVEAYGTVDELNAVLGVAREALANEPKLLELDRFVMRVQHQLFNLGAELATPQPAAHGTNLVSDADVKWLEESIDRLGARPRSAQDIHSAGRFAGGRSIALGADRVSAGRATHGGAGRKRTDSRRSAPLPEPAE